MKTEPAETHQWRCAVCRNPLVMGPVVVSYMGSQFTTDLPKCPDCGWVLITQEVAMGKMLEVEQILEDK